MMRKTAFPAALLALCAASLVNATVWREPWDYKVWDWCVSTAIEPDRCYDTVTDYIKAEHGDEGYCDSPLVDYEPFEGPPSSLHVPPVWQEGDGQFDE